MEEGDSEKDAPIRYLLHEIRAEQRDIARRISALEGFRWMALGAIAVVAALIVPIFIDVVVSP